MKDFMRPMPIEERAQAQGDLTFVIDDTAYAKIRERRQLECERSGHFIILVEGKPRCARCLDALD